ncbi:hypothetical protein PanWU01x14_074850 [Parasponia andersonii]|uniref:Uncharacterized protein n=1 Tax=Parasponia andersonii TaxID=3476 RepID=A0A2P5DDG5_PARAD|nr:hypothetical protein PanWU01x14_074850 [Parasponia andersonii]
MLEYLRKVALARAKIDTGTKVDIILGSSIIDMFSDFKVNYNMHKMNISTPCLMNELHGAKQILLKKKGTVNLTESTSKPKFDGKNKKKKINKKTLRGSNKLSLKKDG